jgi:hypothetical protein
VSFDVRDIDTATVFLKYQDLVKDVTSRYLPWMMIFACFTENPGFWNQNLKLSREAHIFPKE